MCVGWATEMAAACYRVKWKMFSQSCIWAFRLRMGKVYIIFSLPSAWSLMCIILISVNGSSVHLSLCMKRRRGPLKVEEKTLGSGQKLLGENRQLKTSLIFAGKRPTTVTLVVSPEDGFKKKKKS
ncbi:protein-methionine sulfoxide oxidase MICAL1 [Platysternon megacephalum]|uniref:Protein-methionine sulfoxide oxidase MICAL1 n=1 Tax=Platysternon megacephalum TaxID=55544 RepID=A0A4D9EE64_9SAUR|nr:protein-methionine sulfoxide oxidase MICAL1 [Platysternon megacephalum]